MCGESLRLKEIPLSLVSPSSFQRVREHPKSLAAGAGCTPNPSPPAVPPQILASPNLSPAPPLYSSARQPLDRGLCIERRRPRPSRRRRRPRPSRRRGRPRPSRCRRRPSPGRRRRRPRPSRRRHRTRPSRLLRRPRPSRGHHRPSPSRCRRRPSPNRRCRRPRPGCRHRRTRPSRLRYRPSHLSSIVLQPPSVPLQAISSST